MDYAEIKSTSLDYSDRTDVETENRFDSFVKIVEAIVNKKLKTNDMGTRYSDPCIVDKTLYDLPPDYAGMREIHVADGDGKKTLKLATPEYMTNLEDNPSSLVVDPSMDAGYYCIIAGKIQIFPSQNATATLNIVYYKKVVNLTSSAPNNWLSDDHPDCYIFGLIVEISAFNKDAEAKALWDARFKESMLDIHINDVKNRWAGTPMQIRPA